MTRHAFVIRLHPEQVERYCDLHRNAWPEVLQAIHEANLRNYTIFLAPIGGIPHLFSYYEYVGSDREADQARMARQTIMTKWWEICGDCQTPIPERAQQGGWAPMEEVFRFDG